MSVEWGRNELVEGGGLHFVDERATGEYDDCFLHKDVPSIFQLIPREAELVNESSAFAYTLVIRLC